MKERIIQLAMAVAVVFSLSGCFKPDIATDTEESSKLIGYWELVHMKERDIDTQYLDGEKLVFDNSEEFDVIMNDGMEEWMIIRFTESYVTLVATDSPDAAGMLNVPFSYSFDGKTIRSLFFQGDYNDGTMDIDFNGNNTFILSGDDSGTEDGVHNDYYSWRTYNRINE